MITKHNHPVALLIPYGEQPKPPIAETIARLKEERLPLGALTVQDLKEEGRK